MGFLSNLFGKKKQLMLEAIANGAKVIDVRTPGEFRTGNVSGSINMPLDKLNESSIKKIKKMKTPVLVCCASGMRSAQAAAYFKQNGIEDVFNAGSWYKVNRLVNS